MRRKFINIVAAITFVTVLASQAFAKEITVRGQLQRTVEAGGWLLVSGNQQYLLLNAQRYQNESWFAEKSEVEAVGEIKTDVMTVYMQGTPFQLRTLRPVNEATATTIAAMQGAPRTSTKVMVSGDSIVHAQPDTAILSIAVVTQARAALEAQQQNANKSDAVVRALKSASGAGAEIKTSGYTLQPQRVYKENQPPSIVGYEARNTVTVTLADLTKVGAVIDAASQAGANDVGGISFTLRQDRPARDQALGDATREALSKAQVIARALGGRVLRIIEVQEEGFERPRPMYLDGVQTMRAQAAAPTPIEIGTLDITSRVQLVAEIEVGDR